MKVLFLTRRFYPDIGGVEKHVLEISKELVKRGHEITIITESPPSPRLRRASNYHSKDQSDTYSINSKKTVKSIQIDHFDHEMLSVFRLNPGKKNWLKKFRIWGKLFGLISVIRESDVVHCHDVFFWYLPFRFLFPTKKVFTTFHGFETKFPPTVKAKIIRKISEKLSFGNICVGDFIKKWYGTRPDFVTYGGVSVDRKLKTEDRPWKTEDGKLRKEIRILMIGRLEEDNGVEIYLEVLKELKSRKISYNLTVCGDGSLRKQLSKYGMIKGFTHDLNKYIDRADFIFTSSYLSILEALSRGKNVFSVCQNELKKDYLELSPFKKYIYIFYDANSMVDELSLNLSSQNSYNKLAYNWAKKQTWSKVVGLYLKLWKL